MSESDNRTNHPLDDVANSYPPGTMPGEYVFTRRSNDLRDSPPPGSKNSDMTVGLARTQSGSATVTTPEQMMNPPLSVQQLVSQRDQFDFVLPRDMYFVVGPNYGEYSVPGLTNRTTIPSSLRTVLDEQIYRWALLDLDKLGDFISTEFPSQSCCRRYIDPGPSILSPWTLTYPRVYACRACTRHQQLCIINLDGELCLLPLHPQARIFRPADDSSTAPIGPQELAYWISPMANVTSHIENYTGIPCNLIWR